MECTGRHVLVSGSVQGVAFRWYAQEKAAELGISGWIRNLADGRVETWVEAEDERVAAMVSWLSRGPPSAHVTGVEVRERDPEGFEAFEIRPTAFK